ncbi:MAG: hypothetical protein DME43_12680 [Verrucomicrobia bacterium]|nr:MAG: hypothetical protein DME43_12680 [Verrucomicrobiota bacterium]
MIAGIIVRGSGNEKVSFARLDQLWGCRRLMSPMLCQIRFWTCAIATGRELRLTTIGRALSKQRLKPRG